MALEGTGRNPIDEEKMLVAQRQETEKTRLAVNKKKKSRHIKTVPKRLMNEPIGFV